jgi:hypothetical protein
MKPAVTNSTGMIPQEPDLRWTGVSSRAICTSFRTYRACPNVLAAFITTLCLLVGQPVWAAANMLANGDFESGSLNGWSVSGAAATNTQSHGGSWSARITNGSVDQTLSTVVGQTYKATAWIKIESETGTDWGGFTLNATESRNWVYLARTPLILQASYGNNWFKVALTFTATTTQSHIIASYWGGTGRTMVVDVDDITAFAKPVANTPPQITAAALAPSTFSSLPAAQSYSMSGDDPDGAIVNANWDFGDGDTSLSISGSRTTALPGTYTATLTATDDEGGVTVITIPWSAWTLNYPSVMVTTPSQSSLLASNNVLSMAGTASGVSVVQLSTDRDYVGTATGTSSWNGQVRLQPGLNRILVQGRDAAGHIATQEIQARYVPSGALGISNLQLSPVTVARWDPVQITFSLDNSAATHPQFPYEPSPAPGLSWVDGVSVDAECSVDGFQTILRRPGFLLQNYQRTLKSNAEWLYPQGDTAWAVRFAPPQLGRWQCRINAQEASGSVQSAPVSFSVVAPTDPINHGPIRVSPTDSRYFEYADGTTFLGTGHATGTDDRFSYDMDDKLAAIGTGNETLLRWWIPGQIWGSAWSPWNARTLGYSGIVPNTGLSLDSSYGNALASIKLDAANPYVWQGYLSGFAGVIPGRTYLLRIRWRTVGVTGPATSGKPYGITVKLHTQWTEVGQTSSIAALIPHESGTTPWHVSWATFVASGDFMPFVSMILENTTGGAAYVDECAVHEVLSGGTLGPQLLRSPKADSLLTFDPRRGAGMDAIFQSAMQKGVTFKLNISEKQEWLINHFGTTGYPDPLPENYNNGPGTPSHRLHEYYWRHLFARFGAYRSIHSWEMTNEEAPGSGAHFLLTADMARAAQADGNPHLGSTSTWAGLADTTWNDPGFASISNTDFHCYVRGTGWLEPKDALAKDSALFMHNYDLDAAFTDTTTWTRRFSKPTIWGEQGIDGTTGTDVEDPAVSNDLTGVWLHKITWARTGPGGIYPLYWYTNNIDTKNLHGIYGTWNRFMTGIPLSNGRYKDAGATASNPNLRVYGQKDVQAGLAHLWIDNKTHTWWGVVNNATATPASGNVSLNMGASGAYALTWYNTYTGQPSGTASANADTSGTLALVVTNLTTDTALRIVRTSGANPPSAPANLRVVTTGP